MACMQWYEFALYTLMAMLYGFTAGLFACNWDVVKDALKQAIGKS